MCGIVARLGEASSNELVSLPHRGPDQEFRGSFGKLDIIFNRLTITGGDSGTAPVTSTEGRWTCFLNGEIYNFKELISRYELKPSPSDTAVLAEGLQKIGLKFLNNLAGMFAIVAVDNLTSKVLVARDPLGEKPLFYTYNNQCILISSEFRSLMRHIGGPIALNEIALADYFRFGYIEGPDSIDDRIKEFPRGEVVEVGPQGVASIQSISEKENFDFSQVELRELVKHVRSQVMKTEVPYAVLLSGGFDSSTLLSQLEPSEGCAFTLRSGKKVNLEEVRRSSKRARMAGLRHQIVDVQEENLMEGLKEVAKSLDQPHSDMASLGYFRLFQSIQNKGFKLAVSGIGFDEFFWGYSWFNEHVKELRDNFNQRIFWDTPATLKRFTKFCPHSSGEKSLISSDLFLTHHSKFKRGRAEMVHSYLSVNGLAQLDRISMHFSVEARSPYADFRLYLWAQQNANGSKDFGKSSIMKALSPSFFPKVRLYRKRGFDLGMMEYLNEEGIKSSTSRDIYHLNERRFLPFMLPNPTDLNTRERYRMLMLEYWLKQFD